MLQIPPEDPPNNCKSKCSFYHYIYSQTNSLILPRRMLLVPLLPSILSTMLLPMLERERVFGAKARLHQALYEVDSKSRERAKLVAEFYQRSHPRAHFAVLVRAFGRLRTVQVQN